MSRREPNGAVSKLRAMAERFDAAAARAFTVLDHDQRQQDARTLRVVAGMVADRGMDAADLVELWLESAERMLAYYDAADMAVVYGERSARRQVRTEAGA